jgi:hypothetical protein
MEQSALAWCRICVSNPLKEFCSSPALPHHQPSKHAAAACFFFICAHAMSCRVRFIALAGERFLATMLSDAMQYVFCAEPQQQRPMSTDQQQQQQQQPCCATTKVVATAAQSILPNVGT